MALIGSINASNDFGFKNRIINGAMMIDQRNAGASVTVSTSVNTFPVDRMALISTGATTTAQRVAGTGAYAYDVLYTGAASVTASYFFQRIESFNCLDLVSKSVTFQVQLSSTTVTSVAVGLFSAGSTDNFASPVSISSTTFTITSTPTIYTWTVNAGANAANGLQIQLNFGAFTSGTARISGMQLEKGTQATTFDYRDFGNELRLCQRYFERSYDYGQNTYSGEIMKGIASFGSPHINAGASTNLMNAFMKLFLVPKRTQPTMTGYSLTDGVVGKWRRYYTGVSPADDQNVTFGNISHTGAEVQVASGGNCNIVLGHWIANAEL